MFKFLINNKKEESTPTQKQNQNTELNNNDKINTIIEQDKLRDLDILIFDAFLNEKKVNKKVLKKVINNTLNANK
jgi:hypothetical protein